ncbi:hypothetical protein C8R44DRAFT_724806 [Mycena epipterygia]|nr:hypothetical protein C8R44DRAFT_724806 [Mycena epipterygia]
MDEHHETAKLSPISRTRASVNINELYSAKYEIRKEYEKNGYPQPVASPRSPSPAKYPDNVEESWSSRISRRAAECWLEKTENEKMAGLVQPAKYPDNVEESWSNRISRRAAECCWKRRKEAGLVQPAKYPDNAEESSSNQPPHSRWEGQFSAMAQNKVQPESHQSHETSAKERNFEPPEMRDGNQGRVFADDIGAWFSTESSRRIKEHQGSPTRG